MRWPWRRNTAVPLYTLKVYAHIPREFEFEIVEAAFVPVSKTEGLIYSKPQYLTPTTLAHELGHVIQYVCDAPQPPYWKKWTSTDMLKHEAEAWRYARLIWPKLDLKFVKAAFGTYVTSWHLFRWAREIAQARVKSGPESL